MTNVVVLDGREAHDTAWDGAFSILLDELRTTGRPAEIIHLGDHACAPCIGCFGCFVKTPGYCRSRDRSEAWLTSIINSDVVIYFTPIRFGGYSSTFKLFGDHLIQLIAPFFAMRHGDTHHADRYAKRPRLVAFGLADKEDTREATLFRTLIARNAMNFNTPSHAAAVLVPTQTTEQTRIVLRAALAANEAVVKGEALSALVPAGVAVSGKPRRALILNGSPKHGPSSSGVFAQTLHDNLTSLGLPSRVHTLDARLRSAKGRAEFLALADEADLLVFAFPLYVDSLPFLMSLALEHLAHAPKRERPWHIAAVINCGFPEPHQNTLAAAIMERFAARSGAVWAGALLIGGGEAISSGAPLNGPARGPLPPATKLLHAFRLAAEDVAEGRAIRSEAARLAAASPIPLPFPIWRRLFLFVGDKSWTVKAMPYGLRKRDLYAAPLAKR